jgi:hypothetical protein
VQIVFDNAVVDNDDAAGAVAMRVGVLFGGPAMRGPAGVADAERAVQRILAQNLFQVGQLAGRATHLKHRAGGIADGDARRIVAAVFQSPQPFNDDGNHFLFSNITDDSAHVRILSDRAGERMYPEGGSAYTFPSDAATLGSIGVNCTPQCSPSASAPIEAIFLLELRLGIHASQCDLPASDTSALSVYSFYFLPESNHAENVPNHRDAIQARVAQ